MGNKVIDQMNREESKMQTRTRTEAAPTLITIFAVLLFSGMMLMSAPAMAQESIKVEINDIGEELKDAARDIEEAMAEIGMDDKIEISFDDDDEGDKPKLGVYLNNLDFEDAYKMRYPYCHGVLVSGTVTNGNAERAGIIEDDVIMFFDGKKVLYEDHLVRLIRSKHFGDQASIVFFRDESMDSTTVTFAPPKKKAKMDEDFDWDEDWEDDGKKKKHRFGHDVGSGGGGYTPIIVQDDFADVAVLMDDLGLTQTPFQDWGILLHGGGGEGHVGNGWFLGGYGNWGELPSKVNVLNPANNVQIERDIRFRAGLGAFSVKKRVSPIQKLTVGLGMGIGGSTLKLDVTQTEGDFNWPGTDTVSIGTQLLTTANNTLTISKNYFLVHPRVEAMFALTDWMRLRFEYGYLYGYSLRSGWKTSVNNEDLEFGNDYELVGSPNTPLEAPTVSVGLWFGF